MQEYPERGTRPGRHIDTQGTPEVHRKETHRDVDNPALVWPAHPQVCAHLWITFPASLSTGYSTVVDNPKATVDNSLTCNDLP